MRLETLQYDAVEILHGVPIPDPFRWLEDSNASEAESWLDSQRNSCDAYFNSPDYEKLVESVKDGLGAEAIEQPVRTPRGVFFRRTGVGAQQGCLWIRRDDGTEAKLIDPACFSPHASVRILRVSDSGRYMAYEYRTGGTDGKAIRVFDTVQNRETGFDLDARRDTAFVFTAKEDGVLFARRADKQDCLEVVLHPFESKAEPTQIFKVPGNPRDWLVLCSDQVRLGVIRINQGRQPTLDMWVAPADDWTRWEQLLSARTLPFSPILHGGRVFAFKSRGAGVSLHELNDKGEEIRTVFRMEALVQQMQFCNNYIFLNVLRATDFHVLRYPVDGGQAECVSLPTSGTTRMLRPYRTNPQSVFVAVEGPTHPPSIWEVCSSSSSPSLWHTSEAPTPKDCSVQRYSFVTSEGHEASVTLMGRGEPDTWRQRPVVLTIYGGFGITSTPQYSVFATLIVERGALFGLVHERKQDGAEEYTAAHRKNGGVRRSAKDLLHTVAWLRESGIADSGRVGVVGGSHGGLVIALAMALEPEAFHAVVCVAPITDMIRYELLSEGHRWISEYGTRTSLDI